MVCVGLSILAVKNNDVYEMYFLGIVRRQWDFDFGIGAVWGKKDRFWKFIYEWISGARRRSAEDALTKNTPLLRYLNSERRRYFIWTIDIVDVLTETRILDHLIKSPTKAKIANILQSITIIISESYSDLLFAVSWSYLCFVAHIYDFFATKIQLWFWQFPDSITTFLLLFLLLGRTIT